ncbi:hypothetical protein FRC11_006866 [Ceratobasidium sp. 423]|nr:hypothetical protein FRC11_006866 [Ceratobasidium sp. 423]
MWNGHTWTQTSLTAQKVVIDVSKHCGPCVRSKPIPFMLGDLTGFHEISITHCCCYPVTDLCIQLLCTGMMPCLTKNPSSAFMIRASRFFDFLAYDAKLSCSRYHAVLQRQSNNISPQLHQSRLRELLHVSREWMLLQLLKRSGQVSTCPPELGALAVCCPACPRLNSNYVPSDVIPGQEYLYVQLLSYDGSFQLVRKNKSIDQYDTCLMERLMYLVGQEQYRAHLLANKDTAYEQSTRIRYAYTDYGIGSVIQILTQEGSTEFGVFYDIFCQWGKHFWSCAPKILLPRGPLTRPTRFFGGVPKYHLAAHIDSCYAQFSLNNMAGVGRLDAEGCERAWANLNGASGSTSEKGPGARIDALNHSMNDWNWRKLVTMGAPISSD